MQLVIQSPSRARKSYVVFFAVVMGLAHLHLHLHKLIRQLNMKSDHFSEVPGAVATSFILITII